MISRCAIDNLVSYHEWCKSQAIGFEYARVAQKKVIYYFLFNSNTCYWFHNFLPKNQTVSFQELNVNLRSTKEPL